jgi:3'-phosphoadenosine 5'-phosphosulfate sulfotransferase (PAPS reductase)/FAD synthetase
VIYVSCFSFGAASAVATQRAIDRFGKRKVIVWCADVGWEDEDAYRFAGDCERHWGVKIRYHRNYDEDGRIVTPLDVAERKCLIPCDGHAPCSQALKFGPFEAWVSRLHANVTVLLGLDWREMHRIVPRQRWHRARRNGVWRPPYGYQARLFNVYEAYPLLWRPYEFRPYQRVVRRWGIEPPRLYVMGFKHNNCGGRCFRQGKGEWRRLLAFFPERFAQMRDWELAQRAKGGARRERAINSEKRNGQTRPVTLAELEARATTQARLFECLCAC